jgi:hypothetical protein
VREIHCAIFSDDPIASTLMGLHHCNLAEFASCVDPGHREPCVFCSPYVQGMSGGRVVEIIDAVAGVDDDSFSPL